MFIATPISLNTEFRIWLHLCDMYKADIFATCRSFYGVK